MVSPISSGKIDGNVPNVFASAPWLVSESCEEGVELAFLEITDYKTSIQSNATCGTEVQSVIDYFLVEKKLGNPIVQRCDLVSEWLTLFFLR